VADILKAFPAVAIKLGGYTDNTGNADNNLKLSVDRAKSVMQSLVAKGVEASRIESEGYGDQHPVASNDTEEGRNQNRRISIRVTEK
jgi:K(+)-stimulated pyrophosphate-energized sodium pump